MKKSDVLEFFGGCMKTASALGIDHSSVSKWGDEIPRNRVIHVQLAMQAERDKRAKEVAKQSRRKGKHDVQEQSARKA